MLKRSIAAAGAALFLAGGLVTMLPATAQAGSSQDNPLEGTDPAATGCGVGAYVVKAWDMRNAVYHEVQGLAQLVYSPSCGTNWVNVYGFTPGNTYTVVLTSSVQHRQAWAAAVGAGEDEATPQSYTPGSTCVDVLWRIQNTSTRFVEGESTTRVC